MLAFGYLLLGQISRNCRDSSDGRHVSNQVGLSSWRERKDCSRLDSLDLASLRLELWCLTRTDLELARPVSVWMSSSHECSFGSLAFRHLVRNFLEASPYSWCFCQPLTQQCQPLLSISWSFLTIASRSNRVWSRSISFLPLRSLACSLSWSYLRSKRFERGSLSLSTGAWPPSQRDISSGLQWKASSHSLDVYILDSVVLVPCSSGISRSFLYIICDRHGCNWESTTHQTEGSRSRSGMVLSALFV